MRPIISWALEQGALLSNSRGSGATSPFLVPPIGHAIFFLIIFSLWRFPQLAQCFDPKPMFPTAKGTIPSAEEALTGIPAEKLLNSKKSSGDDDTIPSLDDTGSTDSFDEDESSPLLDDSSFLKSKVPESTTAERVRFLIAKGTDLEALENLVKYVSWRQKYESIMREQEQIYHEDDEDLNDWLIASQTAMKANNEENYRKLSLPRVAQTHKSSDGQEACDLDGFRVFHVTPAKIDDDLCSLNTYATAMALYLERKLNRNMTEKVTITLDLRGGDGWRNISAITLIPFIKDIVKLLLTMFPERLHKVIVYPLPFTLTWMFNVVKKVIDKKTADKIYVLSGGANHDSPVPMDQMVEHVDKQVALHCEKERLASFKA